LSFSVLSANTIAFADDAEKLVMLSAKYGRLVMNHFSPHHHEAAEVLLAFTFYPVPTHLNLPWNAGHAAKWVTTIVRATLRLFPAISILPLSSLQTLVRQLPVPLRKIIGDLSNTEQVVVGLDIRPTVRKKPAGGPTDRSRKCSQVSRLSK
jgi:hypothetical protein